MQKVLVVGAGVMGHGIAEVAAIAGYEVKLVDVNDEILKKALSNIKDSLDKLAKRQRLKEPPDAILSRIKAFMDIGQASRDVDIAIEAVPEKLELKRKAFAELGRSAPPNAILATNTSSLPIAELAEAAQRAERVLGLHFFNPPVFMQLVEVIRGPQTSDEVIADAVSFVKSLGKTPILVKKDVPGFVVNRIWNAVKLVACWMAYRGEYNIREIDAAARHKLGLPMGVFELMDFTGLDVAKDVADALAARDQLFKEAKCPLLDDLASKGLLGVKSGKGFYEYKSPGAYEEPKLDKALAERVDPVDLIAPGINMALMLVEGDVASPEDVDAAVRLGLNWPRGPLELADELGLDVVKASLQRLYGKYGLAVLRPSPLLDRLISEGRLGRKTGFGVYQYLARPFKDILYIREPPLAWIVINRPDKLNTMTPNTQEEISTALDLAAQDKDIHVVIIRGAGDRAFSAGVDVSTFGGRTPYVSFLSSRRLEELGYKIEKLPKPVVCAINGYALGGGLELALACDFRIAAESSELGLPEIKLGIFPGGGGTQRLARAVGAAKAKELIMFGKRINATEALQLGVVNKVVPKDKFEDEVKAFALELARGPPIALALAKYAVNFGAQMPEDLGLMLESALYGVVHSTKDAEEGTKAFKEKREPTFRGE